MPASVIPDAYIWYRDYLGDGDSPSAGDGRPVIDLEPPTQPGNPSQPEPVHDALPNDTNTGPGDELPPPQNPNVPNAADGKNNKPSNGGTPASFQSGPAQPRPPPVNTGNPVTPPPDPGANGTPPGIPIFLGPSNPSSDRPPSGDIGPSSNPPRPHGDEKEFEDNGDPSCDGILGGIFGGSLINVLSNNGGDGGDASSGKATSIANGKGGGGLSLSGPGGDASGGSVSAVPGLINILSNNGGNGGKAKSGDSSSYGGRGSSVSHSGPGGDASGGSVHSICSRHLPVSRTSVDHGSGGNVLGSSRSGSLDSKKKNDPPAAYTGKGGNASGGSVKGNHGVVNVWSGNGGNGGDASSGSAFAHGPGAKAYTGPGGNAAGGGVGRREPMDSLISKKMPYPRLSPRGKYVPAHSSTGKFAESKNGGGEHHGGLVNVWEWR
ncbi:hypothetical protein EDB87DRAFT_1145355 [Lactarius vividus]|nr:hypothetical protein EDB87DRAFT_1145355 [Lactarius vividus]